MYYGLMRVGEVSQGDHPVKARDIHAATNKDKILVILRSSKTHGKSTYPQKIKITGNTKLNKKSLQMVLLPIHSNPELHHNSRKLSDRLGKFLCIQR